MKNDSNILPVLIQMHALKGCETISRTCSCADSIMISLTLFEEWMYITQQTFRENGNNFAVVGRKLNRPVKNVIRSGVPDQLLQFVIKV